MSEGKIVIDTRLDLDGFKKGFKDLVARAKELASKYDESTQVLSKQEAKLDKLKNKLDMIMKGDVKPTSLKSMESQLAKTEKEAQKLKKTLDEMDTNVDSSSNQLDMTASMYGKDSPQYAEGYANFQQILAEDIQLGEQYDDLTYKSQKLKETIESIKADPSLSAEAQDLKNQITLTEQEIGKSKEKARELADKLREAEAVSFNPITATAGLLGEQIEKVGNKIDRLKSRMTHLVETVVVFGLIRKALTSLRNGFTALLTDNNEFSASLNKIKTNLLIAFVPIYNYVLPAINALMNALVKITSAIANLVASVFHISTDDATKQAEKLSAAFDNTADSAEGVAEAEGKLAGFDTLEVNSADKSSGGGSGSDFKFDPSGLNEGVGLIGKLKDAFSSLIKDLEKTFPKIFNRLKNILSNFGSIWDTTWSALSKTFDRYSPEMQSSFGHMMEGLGKLMDSFRACMLAPWDGFFAGFASRWSQVAQQTTDSLAIISINVMEAVGTIAEQLSVPFDTLAGHLEAAGASIGEMVAQILANFSASFAEWAPDLLDKFTGLTGSISETLNGFADLAGTIWEGFCGTLSETWDKYGKQITDGIAEAVDNIIGFFQKIYDDIIGPIIDPFLEDLKKTWEEHIQPCIDKAAEFVAKLIADATEIYNKFIAPIVSFLVDILSPVVVAVGNMIGGVINTVLGTIGDVVGAIFTVLGGVIDFITGIFTGNWEKAWDGVKNIFKGIVDALAAIFKAPINFIIDIINGFIRGLNVIKIPDWVPGIGGFGINIPEIPKLATGTVAYAPMVAQIGEYAGAKNNPEIVAPENEIRRIVREESGNKPTELNLTIISKIGEDTLRKQVIKSIRIEENQIGQPLLVS